MLEPFVLEQIMDRSSSHENASDEKRQDDGNGHDQHGDEVHRQNGLRPNADRTEGETLNERTEHTFPHASKHQSRMLLLDAFKFFGYIVRLEIVDESTKTACIIQLRIIRFPSKHPSIRTREHDSVEQRDDPRTGRYVAVDEDGERVEEQGSEWADVQEVFEERINQNFFCMRFPPRNLVEVFAPAIFHAGKRPPHGQCHEQKDADLREKWLDRRVNERRVLHVGLRVKGANVQER